MPDQSTLHEKYRNMRGDFGVEKDDFSFICNMIFGKEWRYELSNILYLPASFIDSWAKGESDIPNVIVFILAEYAGLRAKELSRSAEWLMRGLKVRGVSPPSAPVGAATPCTGSGS